MYELSAKEKNEHGKNSKSSSEGYLVDFLREIGKYPDCIQKTREGAFTMIIQKIQTLVFSAGVLSLKVY
jgi:hypothetical protein